MAVQKRPYFSTANPTVCFSSSGEQNSRSYDLGQPKGLSNRETAGRVFELFRSAHGPADDSWRSWRTVLFDGESNGVLLELWGAKLAELRFMPAQGSSNRQCQCARARARAYSSPIQALPLVYSAPLRDPPLRARPHSVESTVVCCTWLRKYRSPPFEFHVRTRAAVHGMPSIGARVGWSYVLTVVRRRRFIDTKPHWSQTSSAAGRPRHRGTHPA